MRAAVLVLTLLALTSVGGWVLGVRWLGLPPRALGAALGPAAQAVGLGAGFLALNLAIGFLAVHLWPFLSPTSLSVYLLDDRVLMLLSLLQGLIARWWLERG